VFDRSDKERGLAVEQAGNKAIVAGCGEGKHIVDRKGHKRKNMSLGIGSDDADGLCNLYSPSSGHLISP